MKNYHEDNFVKNKIFLDFKITIHNNNQTGNTKFVGTVYYSTAL